MPLQTSCPYVFEDPYRPAHVLRAAYAKRLRERARRRKARQSGLEQPEELQVVGKELEE